MTKKSKIADLPEFDMAEMLKTEEDVANYLTIVLEENDIGEFTHALGVVARARGMSAVAEQSGLTSEALYKALRPSPSSQPRFGTIHRVCNALGARLVARAGPAYSPEGEGHQGEEGISNTIFPCLVASDLAGSTGARNFALGASAPCKRIRCNRGRGASAVGRCMNSSGDIT